MDKKIVSVVSLAALFACGAASANTVSDLIANPTAVAKVQKTDTTTCSGNANDTCTGNCCVACCGSCCGTCSGDNCSGDENCSGNSGPTGSK